MYVNRLVPNRVLVRLRPDAGTSLRAAARRAGAEDDENLISRECRENLLTSAESGIFGTLELSVLSTFLTKEGSSITVKELVAEAEWEGLSEEERASKSLELLASDEARARRREALRAAAEEDDYNRLIGKKEGLKDEGLRAFAPQAALGGSLLVALVSATLLGYFLGRNLFGPKGAWTIALIFGVGTLILEATLLLLRLSRSDAMEQKERPLVKKREVGGSSFLESERREEGKKDI